MLIAITRPDDPRLGPYRDLPQQNLTRQSGLFIAEGEKVVERLIASNYEVASILAELEFASKYEPRLPEQTPIFVASRDLLIKTIGFQFHRGILACGRRKPSLAVDELLKNVPPRATLVVCPDVQDPTNLGSIIRTTAAFGCTGLLLGATCADPFSRRVLRVSMGAALHLPIIESPDLATDLQRLASAGLELVAAVLDPAAKLLAAATRRPRMALLLGSEGHGLSDEWLQLAHRRVTIPMQLGIDSLNVAVAAAVLLYHFCQTHPGDRVS
jgi:tRNA G18 (ribose-2'-O)-methylase SpoU